MKKLFCFICGLCFLFTSAEPASAEAATDEPVNWEISVKPKLTPEQIELARWTAVVENELGLYAYAVDSFQRENDIVSVQAKMIFKNEKILKNLQQRYSAQLNKKERIQYCKLNMQFNLQNDTYLSDYMEVYTDKDRLIDTKRTTSEFTAVPPDSFAEVMLNICHDILDEDKTAQ